MNFPSYLGQPLKNIPLKDFDEVCEKWEKSFKENGKEIEYNQNIQEFMVKFVELALMAISEKSYIVVP
ncbi:Uncharacterised protein [Neisseria gonorrhoeae]|uniref:Uncharacterized protein n=1 Tax=Neisseria gonorrhoeae TaxID=485 RepID=A0A379B2A5_NEIGO|nr:Uncharacterised protein [Neisseria gonorrhoeae]